MTNPKKYFSLKIDKAITKKLKDGTHPIALVVRKEGKRSKIYMGVSCAANQWDEIHQSFEIDKRKKVKLHPDREFFNKWLSEKKEHALNIISSFDSDRIDWTLSQFKQAYLNQSKKSNVLDFFNSRIEDLKESGRIGTMFTYKNTLQMLIKFDTDFDRLVFQDVDFNYMTRLDKYLSNRKLKNNTKRYYYKIIRAVFNYAIKEGEAVENLSPFNAGQFDISKFKTDTAKRYLPEKYIDQIKSINFDDSKLQIYKNMFLFSYYAQGMSFADMARLTKDNIIILDSGRYISYKRQKTGEKSKTINIKITSNIENLLNQFNPIGSYLLPIVKDSSLKGESLYNHIKTQYRSFNSSLKTIGVKLNFEGLKLSTYMSRHSYAMTLKNKGVSSDIISEALGHNDLRVTKTYLDSFQNNEVSKANELL